MSEPKFTPGPWKLWTGCSWRRFGSETTWQTVCEPTTRPKDNYPDLIFRNGGEDGPDARLIAAAPDLYEALQSVRRLADESEIDFSGKENQEEIALYNQIRAALAKAEGGEA